MLRIDFYVQHLLKHQAALVEVTSEETVRFVFPTGERRTNKPVEHAQVVELVREAAPPAAIGELQRSGSASFVHEGEGLPAVRVNVQAAGPGRWTVTIGPETPSAGGAPRPISVAPAPIPVDGPAPSASEPAASHGGPELAPSSTVEGVPGEPRINRWLRMMAEIGGSDLHLCSGVLPMVRHDGEIKTLERRTPIQSDDLRSMLFEIMPARNKTEFEERWDTDFAHTIAGVARFRGNAFVDHRGVGAVFRQIPFEIIPPEKLGLPKQVLDLCWLSKGLVVVTGPTGSGKSTTLAAMIDFINQNRKDHIITIEDPIEFVHPNKNCLVNQREVGTHTLSFKNALRAALREDPDIMLVGELRDLETIKIAIETAETGHLVFGTLHTTTAPSTVDRVIDQFPPEQQAQIRVMLSESLRGVIAQMLCKKTSGGRVAAYEILITNHAVSNLIREGKTYQLASVMQTGKNLGMQTMNEHLLNLVKGAVVDPEEAYIKSNDKVGFKDLLQRNNIALKLAGN